MKKPDWRMVILSIVVPCIGYAQSTLDDIVSQDRQDKTDAKSWSCTLLDQSQLQGAQSAFFKYGPLVNAHNAWIAQLALDLQQLVSSKSAKSVALESKAAAARRDFFASIPKELDGEPNGKCQTLDVPKCSAGPLVCPANRTDRSTKLLDLYAGSPPAAKAQILQAVAGMKW